MDGLLWLKKCKNFGIRTLRGPLRALDSSWSEQSSQILCSVLNAPWMATRWYHVNTPPKKNHRPTNLGCFWTVTLY